ncbi:MAG: hypothetical protein V7K15_08345 [Nostoc sp.]
MVRLQRNLDFGLKEKSIGLRQNISQTLISLCRASCYKLLHPRYALASLRLCGSLRQAEASTLFRNLCVSPNLKSKIE